MTRWTGAEFAEAAGGRPMGEPLGDVTGMSIDTRTLNPGDAFFAIAGDRFDGHEFGSQAMRAGAACLVIAEERAIALGHLRVPKVVVPDVLRALEGVGKAARKRMDGRIAAVTGSVGKTTTKEMLRAALGGAGPTHAAVASFNNHWGVPLTLARMPADAAFGVFEIGMNHPGEITPLVRMARPHVAIITIVAAAHLGAFASVDEIAKAKAEIFEGVEPGGTVLLNADDERIAMLRNWAEEKGLPVRTFGTSDAADYRHLEGEMAAPGDHLRQNARAVFGVVDLLGKDVDRARAAVLAFQPGKGRGERHPLSIDGRDALLIDESYNANPASMRAAVRALAETLPGEGGRRIAVLGDMLELGEHGPELHRELDDVLAENGVDRVLLAGREMKALHDRLPGSIWREETSDLVEPLLQEVHGGDVVVVKSSLGLGFARLVNALLAEHGR